jgi:hypothetical protein
MSQPDTITKRIGTRPKNATQHPGRILNEGHGKRRTAAQKAADDKREREAKEASKKAVQESYQHIATLQAQMQADQDAACADAPKPTRPRACPVKKAANTSKTSNSTMDGGQAEAEIVADKPVNTKGQGVGEKLPAGANVQCPASDEELEVPVSTKTKKKRANKQVVRDAIEAAGAIIATKVRDGDVGEKKADV